MSLYDFIYNLQRKPAKYKKRVLVFLLAVSFLILAVFWFFMFKNQLAQNSGVSSQNETVAGALLGQDKLLSPTAALIEGFKDLKSEIGQKISQFGQQASPDFEDKRVRGVYQLPQ